MFAFDPFRSGYVFRAGVCILYFGVSFLLCLSAYASDTESNVPIADEAEFRSSLVYTIIVDFQTIIASIIALSGAFIAYLAATREIAFQKVSEEKKRKELSLAFANSLIQEIDIIEDILSLKIERIDGILDQEIHRSILQQNIDNLASPIPMEVFKADWKDLGFLSEESLRRFRSVVFRGRDVEVQVSRLKQGSSVGLPLFNGEFPDDLENLLYSTRERFENFREEIVELRRLVSTEFSIKSI